MKIILASKSPRRLQILRQIGYEPQVIVSDVDESAITENDPARLTEELSKLKAYAVAKDHDDCLVIAADTVVSIDGQILGKPRDVEEAKKMLETLSGKVHQVYTGYTVAYKGESFTSHTVSYVYFRTLDEKTVDAYVASGEPMDKAGAYGIQEKGALLVEKICGDYLNIVGLPVSDIFQNIKDKLSIKL